MFGCEAWAHIPDEKWKAFQPKSEKCIFVGYYEDVKGYRIVEPHSHDIIITRDVKFDENILAWEPNLAGVPSLSCEPDTTTFRSKIRRFFPTARGFFLLTVPKIRKIIFFLKWWA